jgi:hypothetical protein
MPGSVTWAFGEPKDFQAALREDGFLSLLVTARGQFRARLTQVTLHNERVSAGDEHLPRIAFVAAPADTLLISFAIGNRPAPIWGGLETNNGELMTLRPGQWVHARTDGPCRWGAIRLPSEDFAQYGRALKGAEFVVSTATRWKPQRNALRRLRHFHQATVRKFESRSTLLADSETVDVSGDPVTQNGQPVATPMPFPMEGKAPNQPKFLADITNEEWAGSNYIARKFIFNSKAPQSDQQHTINSVQFKDDLGRANVQVVLHAVEEWTIENTTNQPGAIDHPLHIHINPYQITEVFDPNEGLVDASRMRIASTVFTGGISEGSSWKSFIIEGGSTMSCSC